MINISRITYRHTHGPHLHTIVMKNKGKGDNVLKMYIDGTYIGGIDIVKLARSIVEARQENPDLIMEGEE